jgi:endonuclease YncB( thermonuclease family)
MQHGPDQNTATAMRYFLVFVFLVVVVGVVGVIGVASFGVRAGANYKGTATVVDGNMFDLSTDSKKNRIRLCGIGAPEADEKGGPEATEALKALIESKAVRCVQVGGGTPCDGRARPISRKRVVARCYVVEAGKPDKEVATEMVCSGHAADWPRFSNGYYDPSKCPK